MLSMLNRPYRRKAYRRERRTAVGASQSRESSGNPSSCRQEDEEGHVHANDCDIYNCSPRELAITAASPHTTATITDVTMNAWQQ